MSRLRKPSAESIYSIKVYGVDYDYEHGRHPCECGDDYCRCGTIEGAHATKVNTTQVADCILNHIKPQKKSDERTIDLYCVERVLVAQEAFRTEMYDVRVDWGYYGQEIDGVKLSASSGVEPLARCVVGLKTAAEKIESVLGLEYNKILDCVKNKEWSIEKVPLASVNFGAKEHEKKVRKSELDMYKDWSLPRGVAIASGDKFRLIDGYHRCSACSDKKIELVVGR